MTNPTPGGWPDAARPGVPQDPERDGWHWLDAGGSPVTCEWSATRGWRDETWIFRAWELPYLGPCHTPAEVAALVEAARREEREACAAAVYGIVADWPVPEAGATFHEIMMRDEAMMAAIRARGDA